MFVSSSAREVKTKLNSSTERVCSMTRPTLLEFVSMLEQAQIMYDTFHVSGATYIEIGKHLGYRFNIQGTLDGGWILPPLGEWQTEWKSWGEYLQ